MKGDIGLLQRPTIAIVGARQCSAAGAKLARMFASEIGRAGFVIASGLARGIDARRTRRRSTPAPSRCSPAASTISTRPSTTSCSAAIGERGCLVSEMPFGFTPRGQDFPRRNRIVSGLSLGVLIVEAARRSGSLVTARLAAEQGREVFAIPGHPLDPRAEGTNKLLKSGATLVTEPEDVLSALTPLTRAPARQLREEPEQPIELPPLVSERDRDRIVAALGPAPVDIDSLVRGTGLSIRSVQIALMELSLAGRIERHGGGMVSLAPRFHETSAPRVFVLNARFGEGRGQDGRQGPLARPVGQVLQLMDDVAEVAERVGCAARLLSVRLRRSGLPSLPFSRASRPVEQP